MTRFTVHVQPGAKSDAVVGWTTGARGTEMLKLRLRAPAVDGKANAGLLDFLAETLGVRPRQIDIERGEKSRQKTVAVEGVSMEEIKRLTQNNLEDHAKPMDAHAARRKARDAVRRHVKPDVSLSGELMAERKEENRREQGEHCRRLDQLPRCKY